MSDLPDNALTTLATVASELDEYVEGDDASEDARVARYVAVASQQFEQYTGRRWYRAVDHTERVAGHGTRRLVVSDHTPVKSIDKIEFIDGESTTEVSDGAYEIEDADLGWIRRVGGTFTGLVGIVSGSNWINTADHRTEIRTNPISGTNERLYRVTYTGGYVTPEQAEEDAELTRTLPFDIEQAVIDFVVLKWRMRGRDQSVASKSLLSGSVSYRDMSDGQSVPAYFADTVARYRRKTVA